MPEDAEIVYGVTHSKALLDCLGRWAKRAKEVGLLQDYEEALEAIDAKLRKGPLDWGEPYRNLRQPHARLSVGFHWVFSVTCAVYEAERKVWITQYRLLPRNPFGLGFDTCPDES